MKLSFAMKSLVVTGLLGLIGPGEAPAQSIVCVSGGGNDMALGVRRELVRVVTSGDDTASVADRAMFHLPKTTESKVSTITAQSACQTAAQHWLSSTGQTFPPTDTLHFIYLKVGNSRQVVSEVTLREGPPGLMKVFDSKWEELASIAY